jgi:hypothetical protein
MIYSLYQYMAVRQHCVLSAVVCGLLTSQLDIVHGVTCDTVSEHRYISHVYWNRILYREWHVIQFQNIGISHMYIETILYREWHVIQFQNIGISHMYIETEYCTWSDTCYSFRTSVYLTCILKQNIVHGVTCDIVSEHQYISHVYWSRILFMEWHVIQFQNISISDTYI